jgi:dinuclear metal center YbgI/SA1388 family protein
MKISEITGYLETLAPLYFQEDYDNCGLLIGDSGTEFQKALLCLDLTNEVMEEAIREHCNLIIAHHPLIFKGLKKLTSTQPETTIIVSAITHNIAVYAIHTNLDNTLQGLNKLVMAKLGVTKCRILSGKEGLLTKLAVFCPVEHADKVRQAMFDAGAGRIGNYDSCSFNQNGQGTFRASDKANPFVGEKNTVHVESETRIEVIFPQVLEKKIVEALLASHPYEEVAYDLYSLRNKMTDAGAGLIGELVEPCDEVLFLERIKKCLGIPVIRHSPFRSKPVRTVALCTGSGSFLTSEAIDAKADAYLTADLKYHDFFNMENRLLLADIGHYESEQWVKEWLYAALIEKFPNFAFLISEVNTNPVHYF